MEAPGIETAAESAQATEDSAPRSPPPAKPVCETPDASETVITSVPALTEAEITATMARLTRRMATAPDEEIEALVAERRQLRAELRALEEGAARASGKVTPDRQRETPVVGRSRTNRRRPSTSGALKSTKFDRAEIA